VAALLNARDRHEVVFTRNITESLNLMAHSYGRGVLKPGQAMVISGMEHHSNIIPWQLLRDERGIEMRVAPITDAGELDMDVFKALLADGKVGLVSMTQRCAAWRWERHRGRQRNTPLGVHTARIRQWR
jgi:cysteine desulfurase / selenocysteine lyase